MMNLSIRMFEKSIIECVNASELPMEVKRLALKEVLAQVEKEADKLVQEELQNGLQQNAVEE